MLAVQEDGRKVSQIQANPKFEYVSGGSWSWTASYLRSLAWYIDDTTRDLGDDLYDRMSLDPQIADGHQTGAGSGVRSIIIPVLDRS